MSEQVVIIGASGHGKVVADIIQNSGDHVVGFLDDAPDSARDFMGFPILGNVDEFQDYKNYSFVVAIGNASIREKIATKLCGVNWYTAIHPSAIISDMEVSVGEGTVIMANAVVNAGTSIGKHCIINSSAVVEHDNYIEDFVHISVGAKLAGTVRIGKKTWVGIGASVSNNICVCENCMIGAGAVIVKNIEIAGTYIGVPAKILQKSNE